MAYGFPGPATNRPVVPAEGSSEARSLTGIHATSFHEGQDSPVAPQEKPGPAEVVSIPSRAVEKLPRDISGEEAREVVTGSNITECEFGPFYGLSVQVP